MTRKLEAEACSEFENHRGRDFVAERVGQIDQ